MTLPGHHIQRLTFLVLIVLAGCAKQPAVEAPSHDLIVRGGTILDGSGGEGYVGDVVVDGDRIVYVGKSRGDTAKTVIDARGRRARPVPAADGGHGPDRPGRVG